MCHVSLARPRPRISAHLLCPYSVRCDLKDLPGSNTGQPVSCTNCRERGLKCVSVLLRILSRVFPLTPFPATSSPRSKLSSYSDAAGVCSRQSKLLCHCTARPWARLISRDNCRAVYGKVPPEHASLRSVTPPQTVIPRLAPEFFDSPFFWRFQIQRTYPATQSTLPTAPSCCLRQVPSWNLSSSGTVTCNS